MENLNELLEKQIEQLNFNRSDLIAAITGADENSPNYERKVAELSKQIAATDYRIDELMQKTVSGIPVETKEGVQVLDPNNETAVEEFLRKTRK